MLKQLSGRVALVTGSSSGIGLGIAKVLASHGASVMVHGFHDDLPGFAKAEIADPYEVAVGTSSVDLSGGEPAAKDLLSACVEEVGAPDILVNNAGIQHVSPIMDFPADKAQLILDINLMAPMMLTKLALPAMKEAGFGRVVNIASVHGMVGSVNKSAYVASKHGVVGFSKVVGLELAGTGVTCNSVNPGWVLTPLVQQQIEARAAERGMTVKEAEIDLLAEKQPSLQFVKPEEVGEAVTFLCSRAAAQITGTTLNMDGGWTAV